MAGFLRFPLIVAAVVVVLRVIVERAGAPVAVSNLLSIAALHTLLAPLYFSIRIAREKKPRPYRMLVMLIGIYAVCTRAMVIPTYWLARIFDWHEPRFAGVDAPNPLLGFIALPFLTAAFWIVFSLVAGGTIGSIVLALIRSRMKTA